jgi:hypothetical protein
MALLTTVLLLIVGIGFLAQREGQYRAAQDQVYFVQAKAISNAGLQDALGKLAKDIDFPPIRANDQGIFSYMENIVDPSGVVVGSFRVSIDAKHRHRPYEVLEISSLGTLGNSTEPRAQVKRTLEIDMATNVRTNNGLPNPNLFQRNFTTTNSY